MKKLFCVVLSLCFALFGTALSKQFFGVSEGFGYGKTQEKNRILKKFRKIS